MGARAELDVAHRRLERDLRPARRRRSPGARAGSRSSDHFYWYTLGVFLVGYVLLKLVVGSPFGRALGGIRENEARMSSLGYNVPLYKLAVFTLAGALAGYAGALACQQPKYFSPDGMSFEVSAVAVVVIVIGGQRSLIGAVLGAAVYYVLRDQLSGVLSSHWQLASGVVFVLVVYLLPGGLVGGGAASAREVATMTAVLELDGVGRRYGELRAVDDVTLEVEARLAPRAYRPERRRQVDALRPDLRDGAATSRAHPLPRHGRHATRPPPADAARHGPDVPALEPLRRDDARARTSPSRLQRKLGHACNAVLPRAAMRDVDARSDELLALVGLDRPRRRRGRHRCRTATAASSRSASPSPPSRGSCCSTSRRRACRGTRRARFIELIGGLPPSSRS